MPDGSATAHLYRPKLLTIFDEGYPLAHLRRDATAGLTVAVVALPLSLAIAVASGVSPASGVYTAVVGGAIVSALGGSRFQIGGPAGAFIILVAGAGLTLGLSGLLTAVFMSGVMLTLLGLLGIGSLVRFIPHPVTVGFTSAIAFTILATQLKDLGGLRIVAPEPTDILPKLATIARALPTLNPASLSVGLAVAGAILVLRHWRPAWPGMLIAVVVASIATFALHLPVETIGQRFGEFPHGLPRLQGLDLSSGRLIAALPFALSFTLLGAIESLLSAKIADAMTGRRHRSNMELIAQGVANMATPLVGGICVTGTIARTATNIRAGAVSPLSGILHALFLLVFILLGASLLAFIPLSALAGVLIVVASGMLERREVISLLKAPATSIVLLTTFGGTLLHDLTVGILAGCAVAGALAAGRAFRKAP